MFIADDINVEGDWLELPYKVHEKCAICKKEMTYEPIIRCYESSCLDLCVQCFSLGLEFQQHKNDHKYHVDITHTPIFPSSDWPAELELELINAVLELGYGNWTDIRKRIMHKSEEEIERHFNNYYIHNKDNLMDLPSFGMKLITASWEYPLYKYNSQAICEEPPRFPVNSFQYRYFSGYNAARGDFEIEHDNSAEELLSSVSFDDVDDGDADNDSDSDLMKELKFVMVQHYNERLKERQRRKRIIRNHGLLLLRKIPFRPGRFEGFISKSQIERLYPFMQLVSGERFDYILEGLDKEAELKRHFCKLKSYREIGLTRMQSFDLYEKLKAPREEMLKELSQLKQNPAMSLKLLNLGMKPILTQPVVNTRKPSVPLNIVFLPGYEKLNEEERKLCSTARIVPESYFTYRDILINESNKNKGIRLATARQMIKIDVNKTRKLFNFLRDRDLITQIP